MIMTSSVTQVITQFKNMHSFELANYYPSEMATLRNKKGLASVAREGQ